MTSRSRNFLEANRRSPVVHASVAGGECFYRLEDGKIFRLTVSEGREIGPVRWIHLADEELVAA